jgi:hypothetical protein
MSNPGKDHFKALERIWGYLNYKPYLAIYIDCKNITNKDLDLLGYTDSDWAGDINNRRSTSGYIFLLGRNIYTWNTT